MDGPARDTRMRSVQGLGAPTLLHAGLQTYALHDTSLIAWMDQAVDASQLTRAPAFLGVLELRGY